MPIFSFVFSVCTRHATPTDKMVRRPVNDGIATSSLRRDRTNEIFRPHRRDDERARPQSMPNEE